MNDSKDLSSIIIGVGDAASKITMDIIGCVNSAYLLLKKNKNESNYFSKNIIFDIQYLINPPIDKIRESFFEKKEELISKIKGYKSAIIIGNFGSKFGLAVLPILTQTLRNIGMAEIICFTIMPFGFEKEKIFRSGVSLTFLQKYADSVIVIDNNSFLKNNPDLSVSQCYKITNASIKDIITTSLSKSFPNELNILATGKQSRDLQNAFINSFSVIPDQSEIEYVKKTFMYIYHSTEKIESIQNVVDTIRRIFDSSEYEINLVEEKNKFTKMHILINTKVEKTIFTSYDPLSSIISKDNILDFEPETSLKNNNISFLRDIESSLMTNNKLF